MSRNFTIIVTDAESYSVREQYYGRQHRTPSIPVATNTLTTALTNMATTVDYPAERFTNFVMTLNSSQVLTQQLQQVQPGQLQASFTLPPDTILYGPTTVGELSFTAVSGEPSAFVALPLSDVSGLKPNGGLAAKAYGQSGQVVVIGQEPLVDAWRSGPSTAFLQLYGNPGSNYLINYATNLPAADWLPGWQVTLTNLWQTFEISTDGPQKFYRVQGR